MSFERLNSPETLFAEIGTFELECGETLEEVRLAYRTWGKPRRSAILICHSLTHSADADDWWPGLIGRGQPFDPEHDFVLCSNVLGSCYGTTGPSSPIPAASAAAAPSPQQVSEPGERHYQADFPPPSIRDIVHLQARWLDQLGVDRLELVTGGSMGGMQALEWALLYPERVETIVPIAVSGRHSPWCIAISEAQRHAIRADQRWRGGYYPANDPPVAGLSVARMIAVCSYRSWASFGSRFGRDLRDQETFQVESYLRYQGQKLTERFDANSYVALTRAMDSHDVTRGREGNLDQVLATIQQPALVISVASDVLYPPAEQQELSCHLPNATLGTIESPHGHDAFLIEIDQLAKMISSFRRSA